ncbi:hypothetical protein QBC39DRAFT_171632 [Podospora conica]|nr:hypothetical protein QBC39DRAFT_171632 [Schizothecium conicum]
MGPKGIRSSQPRPRLVKASSMMTARPRPTKWRCENVSRCSPDHRPDLTTPHRTNAPWNPCLSPASHCVVRTRHTSTPTTFPSRPQANPICQLFHAARPKPQSGTLPENMGFGRCGQGKTQCDRRLPCPAPPHRPSCVRGLSGRPGGQQGSHPLAQRPDLFARTKSLHLGGGRDDDGDPELWYHYLSLLSVTQNDRPQLPG